VQNLYNKAMLPASEGRAAAEECRPLRNRVDVLHRIFDASCAGIGLLLLSPLLCVIAVAIRLEGGGPVFYTQSRMGKGFRPFRVCKFRSMVAGADRDGLLTATADPRLTRVGRWLRRYKLDELPQLFNVLKGEMQLVGARPEVARYVEMFRPEYATILRDRPGITDPATLAYRHEDRIFLSSGMEQQYLQAILPAKLKLSLDYQRRRSFLSDIGILLQTAMALKD
jgi:lipopolysaccharide/colanic/teichoic acid biosynthesis glycosyltransferase